MQKESLSGIILAFYKQRIGRHDFKMLYYLSNVYIEIVNQYKVSQIQFWSLKYFKDQNMVGPMF